MELGVDMIELDVHVCFSGELVVIHDETVDRTTNGKGSVTSLSLFGLKKLTVHPNHKIPTLTEVLDMLKGRVKLNIELKGVGSGKVLASCLTNYFTSGLNPSDLLISSFSVAELSDFYLLCKHVPMALIVEGEFVKWRYVNENIPLYSLHVNKEMVTEKMVCAIHEEGLKLFVYTVNNELEIARLKLLKVDGIFSDYPDLIS